MRKSSTQKKFHSERHVGESFDQMQLKLLMFEGIGRETIDHYKTLKRSECRVEKFFRGVF